MTLVKQPNIETISTFSNEDVALITLYLDVGNSHECALSVIVEQGVLANYSVKKGEHAPVSSMSLHSSRCLQFLFQVRAFQYGWRAVIDEDGGVPHMPDDLIEKLSAFSVHIKK